MIEGTGGDGSVSSGGVSAGCSEDGGELEGSVGAVESEGGRGGGRTRYGGTGRSLKAVKSEVRSLVRGCLAMRGGGAGVEEVPGEWAF